MGLGHKPGPLHEMLTGRWHVVTGLPMAFDVLLLIGFGLMPESPQFLARKGRWEQCRMALATLRDLPPDSPGIDDEMKQVAVKAKQAEDQGQVSYKEVFSAKDRIRYRVMVGVCVQIGQQITGVNFFFSYGPQFAQTAGLNDSCAYPTAVARQRI